MYVTLIRHTSVDIPKGTCYGQTDVPLAQSFPQEAAETKAQLDYIQLKQGPFQAAFSSPLSRAFRLAQFCGFPNATKDPRLMEMNMGDWEMQKYDEINDEALQMWYDDYMNLKATNGEGFPDLYQRVANFLDELKTKNIQSAAIFAHGGTLLAAGIYAGLFPKESCFQHLPPFGGIIRYVL